MHSISSSSMEGKYERELTVISYPARRNSPTEASCRLPLGNPNFSTFISDSPIFVGVAGLLQRAHRPEGWHGVELLLGRRVFRAIDPSRIELARQDNFLSLRSDLTEEARAIAHVAAAGAGQVSPDQQSVLVAVDAHLFHNQPVSGGFPLGP